MPAQYGQTQLQSSMKLKQFGQLLTSKGARATIIHSMDVATFRHSSAHLRQISAHTLQCSMSAACFSHSFAQASQTCAHCLATSGANRLSRERYCIVREQISAQSRSSSMQSTSMPKSFSKRQSVRHELHA